MTGWYVPPGRRLLWYERDGEAVVFNAQSGRTHFLNAVATEVLRRYEAGPQSVADIITHLNGIWESDAPDDLTDRIRSLTEAFSDQGLVDPWRG